jgi:hypothetical protein
MQLMEDLTMAPKAYSRAMQARSGQQESAPVQSKSVKKIRAKNTTGETREWVPGFGWMTTVDADPPKVGITSDEIVWQSAIRRLFHG